MSSRSKTAETGSGEGIPCLRCKRPTRGAQVRGVRIVLQPRGTGLLRSAGVPLRARACSACGHVEVYIEDFELFRA